MTVSVLYTRSFTFAKLRKKNSGMSVRASMSELLTFKLLSGFKELILLRVFFVENCMKLIHEFFAKKNINFFRSGTVKLNLPIL